MNWIDNAMLIGFKRKFMPKAFRVSKDCADMISHFEGKENEAYFDVHGGVWSIGYGFVRGVKEGDYMTDQQIEDRLFVELKDYEEGVKNSVNIEITQGMFDACVSFSYNLGNGAFARSTLLDKLNAGDYKGASEEFPKWVYAGGEKLLGLQRRRDAERLMFLSKDWREYRRTF